METTNPTPITGLQPDDAVARWKAKHRRVSLIVVDDEGERFAGYFKRPDMHTLSAVNAMGKTDEVKAANVLFDNCWLGGADIAKDDAIVKMGMIGKLNEMMAVAHVELKNL